MKIQIIIITTLCLFITQLIVAKPSTISLDAGMRDTSIQVLKIGEKVPDIVISNLVNYSSKTAKISDFKGKILMLDYWATWCGSCIAGFGDENALQKKYKGRVQFLCITDEDENVVKRFLAKGKKYGKSYPGLAFVVGDTLLNKLKDPSGLPTYLWIDSDGILRNITDYFALTSPNIDSLLDHRTVVQKKSIPMDGTKPYFVAGNGGDGSQIQTFSVVFNYVDNTESSAGGQIKNDVGNWYFNACSLKLMYQHAYFLQYALADPQSAKAVINTPQEIAEIANTTGAIPGVKDFGLLYTIPNNRTMLEVKDSTKIVGSLDNWATINKSGCYGYQLIMPNATDDHMRKYMRDDLRRYFDYNVRIEKGRVACLVLTSKDTTLIISKGGKKSFHMEGFKVEYNNTPLKKMICFFNYTTSLPPFIDETGFRGNIDLSFEGDPYNWRSISESLKKYKLILRLEDRVIDMLVIGDALPTSADTQYPQALFHPGS